MSGASAYEGLADGAARRMIREDLDANLIVEAAAGTGKTTELIARIIAVLRSGRTTLDRIVSVTFTEKAAGEMKLRLRAALDLARSETTATAVERAHFDRALSHLELARINTIHGLCADLLRERPVEARVDPLFGTLADDEAAALFDEAFDGWFEAILPDPPEGVRRVLRRKPRGSDGHGPRETLRSAAYKQLDHTDFDAPWTRAPWSRGDELSAVMEELTTLGAFAAQAERPNDHLALLCGKVQHFIQETERRAQLAGDEAEAAGAGHRPDAVHLRRARRISQVRDREVVKGDQGSQHSAPVMSYG